MSLRRRLSIPVFLLAASFLLMLFTYCGGKSHIYTFYTWLVFLPMGAASAAYAAQRLAARGKRALALALLVCLVLCGCGKFLSDRRGRFARIGTGIEDTVQGRFAAEINKTPDPTLLNVGFLDSGFYLAADVLPTQRWFCTLLVNREECYARQSEAVAQGAVDYVVTRDKTLAEMKMDGSGYDLILRDGRYLLYRKRGIALREE